MSHKFLPNTPAELGLINFPEWRADQVDVLESILRSEKRFSIMSAPTGFGKSLCNIVQSKFHKRTCIVTATKGLQDQHLHDFPHEKIRVIKGRDNYQCTRPEWTCADGYAGNCPNKNTPLCKFSNALNAANVAPLVITNFSFWIYSRKHGQGMNSFDLVIFDEAHEAIDQLSSAMQSRISYHEVEEMLGMRFPQSSKITGEGSWGKWAKTAIKKTANAIRKLEKQIECDEHPLKQWSHNVQHLKKLQFRLEIVSDMAHDSWVWDEKEWGWQFDPVQINKFAESFLFQGTNKVTMSSATIRMKTADILGIPSSKVNFLDIPSSFSPERSPIYLLPAMRVDSSNNGDIRQLVIRMDQIMNSRAGLNGIINVTSFSYRDLIVNGYKNSSRMVSHWNDEPVAIAVEKFKRKGGILISPSIGMGYDFPDEECRLILMSKIPFPDNRSKINKARQEIDPEYGSYVAVQKLVQQSGRGTRSKDDWCENFLLDAHLEWFIPKFATKFAPKWWRDRLVNTRTIPGPLSARLLTP